MLQLTFKTQIKAFLHKIRQSFQQIQNNVVIVNASSYIDNIIFHTGIRHSTVPNAIETDESFMEHNYITVIKVCRIQCS